jgi:hypothetical protein
LNEIEKQLPVHQDLVSQMGHFPSTKQGHKNACVVHKFVVSATKMKYNFYLNRKKKAR